MARKLTKASFIIVIMSSIAFLSVLAGHREFISIEHEVTPTTVPAVEVTTSPASVMIPFMKNISYSSARGMVYMTIRSKVPKNISVNERHEVVISEVPFSNHIILSNNVALIDMEYNLYDAGGFVTANDSTFEMVANKLDKSILRDRKPNLSSGKYSYFEFYKGPCEQQAVGTIVPIFDDLNCGFPWFSVQGEDLNEIVQVECEADSNEGLKICDQFVENLEIEASKEEL